MLFRSDGYTHTHTYTHTRRIFKNQHLENVFGKYFYSSAQIQKTKKQTYLKQYSCKTSRVPGTVEQYTTHTHKYPHTHTSRQAGTHTHTHQDEHMHKGRFTHSS